MKDKAIIIGASTTGKSTLMKYLQENTDLMLDEMDEILIRMNNGIYPKDGDHRHKVLEPRIVQEVLRKDPIVFFTNTHIFSVEDLEQARKLGFKIFQLLLSREKMESRNIARKEQEDYDDISMYFKYMIEYQEKIRDKGVVDKEIDADQPVENNAKEVLEALRDIKTYKNGRMI